MRLPRIRRPEALFVILLCFLGSGAVRIWENGAALAQEIGAMTAVEQAAEPVEAKTCPPQLEPESLLKAIREREAQLDSREERLNDREQLLRVSQLKIEDQLNALQQAEEKLAATISLADQAAEQDIARLTTVYENMKPKEAAKIFETMDVNFAAGFLIRMAPDAAAGIMTNLNSDAAYSISVVMAGRNARAPKE